MRYVEFANVNPLRGWLIFIGHESYFNGHALFSEVKDTFVNKLCLESVWLGSDGGQNWRK